MRRSNDVGFYCVASAFRSPYAARGCLEQDFAKRCLEGCSRNVANAVDALFWCGVECTGCVGRQIVQHDPDALCPGKVKVREFAHARGKVDCGTAVRSSYRYYMSVTLTLRQDRCTSRKMNRLAVPLRLYSQS
jgi:hypothetical protein